MYGYPEYRINQKLAQTATQGSGRKRKKLAAKADKTSQRRGKLLVLCRCSKRFNARRSRNTLYLCQCECGNYSLVNSSDLLKTLSCGCLSGNRKTSKRAYKNHGLSTAREYSVWRGMMERCYGINSVGFSRYGGRGIQVGEDWREHPEKFILWLRKSGWKKGLQVDRIDNDGNYTEENCRLTSCYENVHNTTVLKRTNKSGYAGVSERKSGRYQASINAKVLKKQRHHLGTFDTPEEAAQARNNFIISNQLPHKIQEVI